MFWKLFNWKTLYFDGLFVFSLFWIALFPKHKNKIFALTIILFVFWKSKYSSSFINYWNSIELRKINRTIDYSDIIALSILPLCYYLASSKEKVFNFRLS
jgi:hypothetical protein